MATSDLVAGTVMNLSASLMNDTARTTYTYADQVPYLQMAMDELQEYFELHNVSVTDKSSAVIQVDAGEFVIAFNAVGQPALPDDMIEPLQLWERNRNIDPYIPMARVEFLPRYMEGIEINQFLYWTWQSQQIILLPSNQDNDIKMDYTRALFTTIVNESSQINIINAKTFLAYRTAGLMAEFIERNIPSAASLNNNAVLAIDRATGITVKGKQNIMTRRRPFRQSYKIRGVVG